VIYEPELNVACRPLTKNDGPHIGSKCKPVASAKPSAGNDRRGAPLQKSLDELTLFVEDQEKDARCGILVLDHRGKHFRHGGGANLPENYHKALDFISIDPPYFDACGEAAHLAMPVIVPDIAAETR